MYCKCERISLVTVAISLLLWAEGSQFHDENILVVVVVGGCRISCSTYSTTTGNGWVGGSGGTVGGIMAHLPCRMSDCCLVVVVGWYEWSK
mgnify:CR=1 FL=1